MVKWKSPFFQKRHAKSLESVPEPKTKEEKQAIRTKKKQLKELDKKRNKLHEYDQHLEIMGERNSYSKTDSDATFMHMKEVAICRLYPGLVCPFRIASSFICINVASESVLL